MKIIGHRGAKGLAPENTIASFKKALEHHVDEIECDVRVTKDGIPVLHHDDAIDMNGTRLEIRSTNYKALMNVDPNLMKLEDLLLFAKDKVDLLIEVKPKEAVLPITAVLSNAVRSGYDPTKLALGSFSQKTLRELHRELPVIEKVVIERWSGVKATIRANQVQTKRLNMKQLWLWNGFLAPMKRRGWKIAPYTLNDPAKVRRWEKNLYGIITDFPDRFEK